MSRKWKLESTPEEQASFLPLFPAELCQDVSHTFLSQSSLSSPHHAAVCLLPKRHFIVASLLFLCFCAVCGSCEVPLSQVLKSFRPSRSLQSIFRFLKMPFPFAFVLTSQVKYSVISVITHLVLFSRYLPFVLRQDINSNYSAL